MILVDTNQLLRFSVSTDSLHPVVLRAVAILQAKGEPLCIFPQNLYEFWVSGTRPKVANGFGLTVPECLGKIAELKQLFLFLPDPPGLFDTWEQVVSQNACHGKVAHDARLVAAMQLHGVAEILTFNVADFARFPGITAIDPASVAP